MTVRLSSLYPILLVVTEHVTFETHDLAKMERGIMRQTLSVVIFFFGICIPVFIGSAFSQPGGGTGADLDLLICTGIHCRGI